MANNVDPDQTAPIGAVCSGSTMFASILNWSVMLGNYLQQSTSPHDIFRCIFFLGASRVNSLPARSFCNLFLSSADFFSFFFKILSGIPSEYHQSVKQFESRSKTSGLN